MSASSQSVRYQHLMKGIEKVLVESRNKIRVKDAVKEGYGDDASVFGEDQIEGVLEGMLDIVHSSVANEMAQFLQAENVENDIIKVEEILKTFDSMERAMQEMNEKDRESAKAALEQAQLPEGVKPTDVVKYRAYNVIMEEREKVSNLIEQYRDENNELEKLVRDARAKVESEIVKIEEVSRELDRTADVCSTLF
ncbi:hypothetical protein MHU86_11793 [Fragilaria crotonensis]|nr:hypothetical protein MHU86_11793 [Fragilaria crotonensis]